MKDVQFSLKGSDQGFSAIDDIIDFLKGEINSYLNDIEVDHSIVGLLITYLHILACVGEGSGGYGQIRDLNLEDLRSKLMNIYGNQTALYKSENDYADARKFIGSVIDRLKSLRIGNGSSIVESE